MRLILLSLLLLLSLESKNLVVVAVDAGHTPKRFGTLSATGVKEFDYNYKLAQMLQIFFKKAYGFNAYLINSSKKEISLKDRLKEAKEFGAELFISIHHDSVQPQFLKRKILNHQRIYYTNDPKFSGYSIFVSKKNSHFKESLEIAKAVGESLKKSGFKVATYHSDNVKGENRKFLARDLGVYQFDDLIVLKYATTPAILIETGVIVNEAEERRVSQDRFKVEFSTAVVRGVAKALNR